MEVSFSLSLSSFLSLFLFVNLTELDLLFLSLRNLHTETQKILETGIDCDKNKSDPPKYRELTDCIMQNHLYQRQTASDHRISWKLTLSITYVQLYESLIWTSWKIICKKFICIFFQTLIACCLKHVNVILMGLLLRISVGS